MTVLEVIQRGTEFLAGKGVDSPRLQVELLLAHVLGVPRLRLYLQFDRVLDDAQVERSRELVRRRGRREPLQHLVGSTSFCGYEFLVSPAALIPRPETELLAEFAWTALAESGVAEPVAADYGTGTGCLLVTLALKCPALTGYGLEISPAALELARANAARHGVSERLQFCLGDGWAALPAGRPLDLLISNPPYIPTEEIAQLQPEVRDFDPPLALDGGEDGLRHYRRLAAEGAARVRPGGVACVELGDGQAEAVRTLFEAHNWIVAGVEPDYSGRPRILRVVRGPGAGAPG